MKFRAACLFLSAAGLAAAQPGQQNTPAGSAFISACAGVGVYASVTPGRAWNDDVSANGTTCNAAIGGFVTQTATASGGTGPGYSEFAGGTATFGGMKMSATNSGNSSYAFPDGVVNAGWNENLIVNVASGDRGMQGYWVFALNFNGNLSTTGPDPDAEAWVEIFQNNQMVTPYASTAAQDAYNYFLANNTIRNGPIYSSWDDEQVGFLANNSAPSLPINTVLYFAVPVTVGQQFELGIWCGIRAGEGSSGASSGPDTARTDFSHTMLWGGSMMLVIGGQQVAGLSVTSQSGFDYNSAATSAIFTLSPCDVNQAGRTNVGDVQTMVNEVLGAAAPANDLNADGMVSVADLQIVINAALGGACSG